ncbi:Disease resistance protein RPM1 [Sesamum alatum]|uniref:Disease resistance protein RPM1 n=1 Tax=Sesamum alatum TaxID=300844 RepID=A0AAE2CXV1_9LAMI|nr:Disease resistance protein RPM1 [Sesamum alatum]
MSTCSIFHKIKLTTDVVVYQGSFLRQDIVVGFEDEAENIIQYLNEESKELDVISIVGMSSLGKTTLARKILRDPRIEYEFPTRLWVYVSQVYRVKDIFLSILRDLSWITEDMYDKTKREIAQTLRVRLEKEKFLIVLDDMWTTRAWDDLRDAFPMTNKMSKILITSRMINVAYHTNHRRQPHQLRFLRDEESWELLQLSIFGKLNNCLKDLEFPGKVIADMCDGLPLVIMLVGGVLAKTTSAREMKVIKSSWMKTKESMRRTLHMDRERRFEEIVMLSYNSLPSKLKPCFLYLEIFQKTLKSQLRD